MYKLPERGGGGGGGEVIRAMPERKHSFLKEVLSYLRITEVAFITCFRGWGYGIILKFSEALCLMKIFNNFLGV